MTNHLQNKTNFLKLIAKVKTLNGCTSTKWLEQLQDGIYHLHLEHDDVVVATVNVLNGHSHTHIVGDLNNGEHNLYMKIQ